MSRGSRTRLLNILASCETIARYLRSADPEEGTLYDAIRVHLIENDEAAKDLPSQLLNTEPTTP